MREKWRKKRMRRLKRKRRQNRKWSSSLSIPTPSPIIPPYSSNNSKRIQSLTLISIPLLRGCLIARLVFVCLGIRSRILEFSRLLLLLSFILRGSWPGKARDLSDLWELSFFEVKGISILLFHCLNSRECWRFPLCFWRTSNCRPGSLCRCCREECRQECSKIWWFCRLILLRLPRLHGCGDSRLCP